MPDRNAHFVQWPWWAVCCWLAIQVAATATEPTDIRVVTAAPDGGRQAVAGRLLVEARDGSLLVETATQQIQVLAGDQIISRTMSRPAEPLAPRELGRQTLAELPAGFRLLTTRHYLICHDTSLGYARWAAALLEQLHQGFHTYFSRLGLPLQPSERPLIVVIFSGRREYEAAAARDVGAASHSIVGYYNQLTNRITTFDITGLDALQDDRTASAGQAGLALLNSPRAASLVATLVHEATHQLAFNTGLHQRLAPVPVWVSEGIATYFETPELATTRGWRTIGGVNRPRLDLVRRQFTPGLLDRIITSDEPFRDPDEALVAYAHAWATIFYLAKLRRTEFASYLQQLSEKAPLAADSADLRRQSFRAAFDCGPEDLEQPLLRYLATLPSSP